MNPEIFLEEKNVIPLIQALMRWATKVNSASERKEALENAGIKETFIFNLRLDTKASQFAQSLVAAFMRYRFSNQHQDYHPLVKLLQYLINFAPIYELGDEDINLFAQLVKKGQENLNALTACSSVGRVELPGKAAIGTGVFIGNNWLLTCNHIFSKIRVERAYVRFNYTSNSYELDSDVFELNLSSVQSCSQKDYALVPIKGELQQQQATPINGSLNADQDIRLIHHPKGKHVVISDLGQIVQVGRDYIDHNINTSEGSSGAPIFDVNWQLVAIHRGHPGIGTARTLKPGTTSAVPLYSFWKTIQTHLS